jgi:hypothetical protein
MQQWRLNLPGDPAWWQAVAAIANLFLTAVLVIITRRYVVLTNSLVKLQGQIASLERQSLRRELYDRRLNVYDMTRNFLAYCDNETGNIPINKIQQFLQQTREAEFLFEPEASAFIEEVRKKAIKYHSLNVVWNSPQRTDEMQGMSEIQNWLGSEAFSRCKEIFSRYLKLTEDPE